MVAAIPLVLGVSQKYSRLGAEHREIRDGNIYARKKNMARKQE